MKYELTDETIKNMDENALDFYPTLISLIDALERK